MSGAVGIDLGTTFSAIACVNKHGQPDVLLNVEGDRITPSVVLFEGNDVIVGNYAKQAAVVYPEQVAEFVKRHMGDPNFSFSYRGRDYTPEELSSFILAKLKHDAELRLGHPVEHAVITVPAYFNDHERRATIRAGERAGLNVLKLLNEPTAAAFAYGLNNIGRDQRVLVYDLGGGTFDVTMVDIIGKDIQVIATAGDHHLGGKDFDDALIAHMAKQFEEKHGIDPLSDLHSYHDLRQKCVSAKISLTRRPKVNIFHDFDSKVMRLSVTRESFEELTRHLMERCEALTLDVLREAKAGPETVDTVLLAGGSTRMPMVRKHARAHLRPPTSHRHQPRRGHRHGRGAHRSHRVRRSSRARLRPSTSAPTTSPPTASAWSRTRTRSCHNSKIIRRNTRIPADKTRDDYTTTHDNQTTMDLWLVQGEKPDPLACTVLGHFEFYGIPPRKAGASSLAVTFRYNANGIVEVEAMDLLTGQILPHRLASGQVSLEDLAHNRAPMHVALIMDCSGSMYGQNIADAKAAAASFAERTLNNPNRSVAVIAFPGGVKTPATSDLGRVRGALEGLTPIGSTPLSDGLHDARDLLRPHAGVQRVFVVMTDGHPDDPDQTVAEIHRMKASGARVITIGVGEQVDQAFLASLASQPSDYHFCNESIELKGTFINLATELAG